MRAVIVACACVALAGCDEDPAHAVKIIERRPLSAEQAKELAQRARSPLWRPSLCPAAEASKGQGSLAATGACSFEQTEQVGCIALGDDFFIELVRPSTTQGGATLRMFGNVESYQGPGRYEGGSLLVSLRTDSEVFPWNGDGLTMTVAEDERYVKVEPAVLHPGFMREAGPMQVSGVFWCKAIKR